MRELNMLFVIFTRLLTAIRKITLIPESAFKNSEFGIIIKITFLSVIGKRVSLVSLLL